MSETALAWLIAIPVFVVALVGLWIIAVKYTKD